MTEHEKDWFEPGPATVKPQSEFMREYELRRCHICRCRYPSFGFGPPLTKPGLTIWACLAHRTEVDRLLAPLGFKTAEQKLL